MYYLVMSESGKGAREKTHTGYACNTGLEAMPTLQKKEIENTRYSPKGN